MGELGDKVEVPRLEGRKPLVEDKLDLCGLGHWVWAIEGG